MVRDTVAYICRLGCLPVDVEARHLLSDDVSDGERPADILIHHWKFGKSLSLDVSIANSLQYSANLRGRPFDPLEPIKEKAQLKITRYRARCETNGLLFEPFICGSLGGLNVAASDILKRLGTAVANVQGISRSYAIARVRKMVSFAVQKAQANAWIRRGVYGEVLLY